MAALCAATNALSQAQSSALKDHSTMSGEPDVTGGSSSKSVRAVLHAGDRERNALARLQMVRFASSSAFFAS